VTNAPRERAKKPEKIPREDTRRDGQEQFMEPEEIEEMDLVEVVEKVDVEASWRIGADETTTELHPGERGMVVHRHEGTPALFDVEFLDPQTNDVRLLARLRLTQLRVIARDTLGIE
jgi:hypothetical protein